MDAKGIIELILSGVGLFISFVAIWQSRKSIRLTEKSIRDANRPYIGINVDYIDTVYYEKFLLIKNYGNSSAKITSLEFLSDVSNEKFIKNELQSAVGGMLMPGQKLTSFIYPEFKGEIKILIHYEGLDGEEYSEQFNIKTDFNEDFLGMSRRDTSDSDIATAIKQGAQSISKTLK